MRLYKALSRTPLRRTYLGKLVLAAVAGGVMPIIALLCYLALAPADAFSPITALLLVLAATFLGIAVASWLLNALIEPLRIADRLFGASGAERDAPDVAGRLLAAAKGTDAGIAAGSIRSTERFAHTDPVTGLRNRHWCEMHLADAVAGIAGQGEGLVLALLALDGLEVINKRHGSAIGDECLCAVARVADATIRTGDRIARWEDNVFLVVLRGRRDHADSALRRLRRGLAESSVTVPAGDAITLTVSTGAVTGDGMVSSDALVRGADRALQAAKRQGGDTLVWYPN